MTAADAEAVLTMSRTLAVSVSDPLPEVTSAELLQAGSDGWFDCFVAELGTEIAGYALVCKAYEAHTGKKRLWLGDLYVKPSARGTGTARALVARIARHALDLGCDAVYWDLWRPNAPAAGFYERINAETVDDLCIMRLTRDALVALGS